MNGFSRYSIIKRLIRSKTFVTFNKNLGKNYRTRNNKLNNLL